MSGNSTFDTNTLYVDAVNHRVGIGTTAPGRALDIVGRFGSSSYNLGDGSGSFVSLKTIETDGTALAIITNNAERFRIAEAFAYAKVPFQSWAADQVALIAKGAASQTANIFQWQNSSGTALGGIDASGNVGIGTTAPAGLFTVGNDKFQVDSSGNVSLAANASITLTSGTGIYSQTSTSAAASNFSVVNTSAFTGTGATSLALIYGNSATTGDIFRISGTSLTTGTLLTLVGPSGAVAGATDSSLKLTSNIGNIGTSNGLISSSATVNSTAASSNGVNLYLSTLNNNTTNANTVYGIYNSLTDIKALANTNYGSYISVANTGALNGAATKNIYGEYVTASGTGATTNAGIATNVYGGYFTTTASHATDNGTVNQYGLYVPDNTAVSTNGTSSKYGLYVGTQSGADTNYAAIFAGGNVGIGTTAPVDKLSVVGSTNINDTAYGLKVTTDAYNSTGQALRLANNADTYWLTIGGFNGAYLRYNSNSVHRFATNGTDTVYMGSTTLDGGLTYSSLSTTPLTTSTVGLMIQGKASQTADLMNIQNSAFTKLFVVKSDGKVGIGTTAPGHKLDVAGNIGLSTSSYINWGATDGTSGYGIRDNSGTMEIKSSGGSWTPVGIAVLPQGYLSGLTLSNNAVDTLKDIDVATGVARDTTDAANMNLNSVITKQLDAAWAVGTNQGGLDTVAVEASKTYHVWLIKRSDTSVVDVLYSLSATSPTMPASYDYKRRIGAVLTDASSNIIQFVQDGNMFTLRSPILDVNVTTLSTSSVNYALSTPLGIKIDVIINPWVSQASNAVVYIRDPQTNDDAPSGTIAPIGTHHSLSATGDTAKMTVKTNTSSQISARSSAANTTLRVATLGWIDYRTDAVTAGGGGTSAAGLTGYLQFNSAGALAGDAGLFWDNSNKRLGLGTAAPSTMLDISQFATASTAEEIAHFAIADDAVAYISIRNGSTTDALFSPQFRFRGSGSTTAGNIQAMISTDSGTSPALVLTGQLASSVIATRPILAVRNYTTDLMTVLANGNVGIGTTAPSYALDVKVAGTGIIARFNNDNTAGCTIADGGTISCSSDRNLKKNILGLSYGLEDVMKLNPVSFNWNFEGDDKGKSLGFIAQDVENLIPGLVATDEKGIKSLNTIGLIPVLTKAIQEQEIKFMAFIDQIKNKFRTKELCLGEEGSETCVTKTQLDELIKLLPTPTPTPQPEADRPLDETASPSATPVPTNESSPTPVASPAI